MFSAILSNAWCTLSEVYNEFSAESSIHGIKYITKAKSTAVRFLWLIVITMSILASIRLASLFYGRHQSASMSTVIISNEYPTWKLALPAVTLCHGNLALGMHVTSYSTSQKRIYMPRGLTRTDFENSLRYLREAIHPTNHFTDELDKLQLILSANRLSLLELLQNISPNCSNFLIMCQIYGKTVPCDTFVDPVMTPYGICCAFNYENPRQDWQRRSERERHSNAAFGSNFVLSFLLRSFPSHDRISSVVHGDGVKVIIHETYTFPSLTSKEFVAASGYETIARLYGYRLTSSDEVLGLPPHTRGCTLSSKTTGTATTTTAYPYRTENCLIKCQQRFVQRICNCQPFSSILLAPSSLLPRRVCNLTNIPCLSRITRPYLSRDGTTKHRNEDCDCLPDCEDTTYRMSVATSPLSIIQYNPSEFYQQVARHSNSTVVHVTFASQSGTLLRRELVLPKINLVSSLGGVFSLFLGCSFISIIEIFYFFFVYLPSKLRHGTAAV